MTGVTGTSDVNAQSDGPDPKELLEIARAAALEAGALVARMRVEGVDVAATKTSATDVVTAADHASEELIRSRVLARRPDDGFLGEEGDDVVGTSGVRWIADPIDGTVNYLYGLPNYAVSIAAEVNGTVMAGFVYCPGDHEEYAATLGGGATLDGAPLSLGPPTPLARALVGTGFSYEQDVRARQGVAVARMLPRVRDVRRLGSAALDLCAVATGRFDAYVEEGTHLWDRAAGALVATEAGARVEVVPARSGKDLLMAAPTACFDAFRALVTECDFGLTGH